MTTTTQDTRALIARLQARLGEGTIDFPLAWYKGEYTVWLGHSDDPADSILTLEAGTEQFRLDTTTRLIAAALNELPGQIARWLARLDSADDYQRTGEEIGSMGHKHVATTLLATVTEDVQAWAVRLGVGE